MLLNLFSQEQLSEVDRRLVDAVEIGDLRAAQSAIAQGAVVNRRDLFGSTPLHTAAWRGDLAMARLLITAGAHVDISDSRYGETPLHSAARGVEPAMMAFLLKTGADPQARIHTESEQCNGTIYPAGATALDIARMNGLSQLDHILSDNASLVQ
jgi:ankyrin repeat protein